MEEDNGNNGEEVIDDAKEAVPVEAIDKAVRHDSVDVEATEEVAPKTVRNPYLLNNPDVINVLVYRYLKY
jgi:hypothetical protein